MVKFEQLCSKVHDEDRLVVTENYTLGTKVVTSGSLIQIMGTREVSKSPQLLNADRSLAEPLSWVLYQIVFANYQTIIPEKTTIFEEGSYFFAPILKTV